MTFLMLNFMKKEQAVLVCRPNSYTNSDKNILDESYYVVSKTFPRFPSLGVQNCFFFKVKLLVLSNSVLAEQEILEMFY